MHYASARGLERASRAAFPASPGPTKISTRTVRKNRCTSAVLGEGEPATVFRYDVVWEFVSAITEQRDPIPSFYDGLHAQVAADNVLASYDERRWVEIPDERR